MEEEKKFENNNKPEEEENKTKKIIIDKVNEKITKDKQRSELRKENLNSFKKIEMMSFERTKFEFIQKSSKKFTKITEENKKELLDDIEKYNYSKIIDEIIKNILDSKFEFKDVNAIILILSELNQIYEKFDVKYSEAIKKQISDFNETLKTPPKNEDDEEKRNARRKNLLRLQIESYLYGLLNDFNIIRDLFVSLISPKNPKEQFLQDFPVLVNLMKIFAEPLFGIKSKSIRKLIDKGEIQNYELSSLIPKSQMEKYYSGFKDFYYKLVLVYLEEENKNLLEMEKKNYENMKKLDSNNEINQAYQKQRAFYLKYINLINEFAEIMNFDVPDMANEKIFRYEEQKKNEMKMEKINKYDPFSDEVEYCFYVHPLNIKDKVSEEILERIRSKNKEDSLMNMGESDDILDASALLNKILKCDSQETIDEASLEFIQNPLFLVYKYRKAIVKSMLRSSKSNLALLRYFSRFIANLSPYYKDLATDTSLLLIDDYNDLNKEEKLGMFEEKIKNIRFIAEMVKFDLFPIQNIFEILKRLIDDLKGHSIDILCQMMESCGRFLYLNEICHLKFNSCLETIKQIAHHRLRHDERSFNSIMNCLQVCKPQESTLKKQVKVRPVEEEYIRFLIFQLLNKESIKKIAILLRRMDWEKWENTIFKVIYKYLNRGNENQIKYTCAMLSLLKDYQPNLIFNLINVVLEEIRIGLERNDFNDNQHKILTCMLISNFYTYKLINSDILFYTLYMILTYNPEWNMGKREFIADNQIDLPSDTFRIQMVITLLDICGNHLNTGSKKEKLNEFLHFMQLYVLSKQYLPLEVENRITNCLENLYSKNYQVYTDFTEALKDSKKYKGFEFDFQDLNEVQENKSDNQINKNEFNRGNVILSPSEDPDFKRKKENVGMPNMNIDEEIQKIISESLIKAKASSKTNIVINPLQDIKKKDLNKASETNKLKLITKQSNSNKIVVREIDKNFSNSNSNNE